jgi:hypothetical protein
MTEQKVVDLKEYRSKQEMKKLIKKLDSIADHVYENYDRTEQKGYENFKKLLKTLDAKYEKED